MSDTTDNNDNTDTDNTDEPSKAELHERVNRLESTVEKLMPSRRDALKLGAAGIAGAAGLSATTQTADASTGSAGQIGEPSNRPTIFADDIDANQLTGVSTGGDRQGCRVFLSSNQSFSANTSTKIQFDSEVYDDGSNFDTATHEWTCPKDGLYMAHCHVRMRGGSNGDTRSVFIGSGTTRKPNDEGSLRDIKDSSKDDIFETMTVNRYTSGDTIAGYVRNVNSNDSLDSGTNNFRTFMEVAFLGGL